MAHNNTIPLTCWLLDTRPLWPGARKDNISKAAPDVLELLPPDERESCTRMLWLPNGKERLGSALLKRYFVSKTLGIPWKDVRYARKDDPKHGKPSALLPDDTFANLDFNVSHQAELIALVGTGLNSGLEVGVDIVCTNERYKHEDLDRREGGFDQFVDEFDSVFSKAECRDLKDPSNPSKAAPVNGFPSKSPACEQTFNDDELYRLYSEPLQSTSEKFSTKQKLRRFFIGWSYKEAYLKMEGLGLLAPWTTRLEFFGIRAPFTAKEEREMAERNARVANFNRRANEDGFGERIDDAVIFFEKKPVRNVSLSIQAYDEHYMMAVAVRPAGSKTKSTDQGQSRKDSRPDVAWSFEKLTLGEILEYARSNRQ